VNKVINSKGDGLQPGMRLRGSLTARIYNSAVLNFDDCVRIDDSDHDNNDATDKIVSNVTLSNVIGQCDDKFYAKRDADTEEGTVGAAAVDLDEAVALTASTVAEIDFVEVNNGSGFVFDNTTYVGAVAPGTSAATAWWAGWIIPGSLDGIETQGE
jgi:Fe-S cluster assembly iron-binding protein IscA